MTKTIVEKLNLNKYETALVLNMPLGEHLLEGLKSHDTDWKSKQYDLIFAFVLDMTELQQTVQLIIDRNGLRKSGYLFLAYPKKGNKVYTTYIHRDDLLSGLGADENGYVGNTTIKFARMVGLNDVFTVVGLKEEAKKAGISTATSQSVSDYISYIPELEAFLQSTPDLLKVYQALTPGYQRDWARYVYSAKQEATRVKRREEMKQLLAAGYKSKELYMKERR